MISRRHVLAGAAVVAAGGAVALGLGESAKVASKKGSQRAPNFSVLALDGMSHYRLDDFAGKVLLLNFWATWCTPCRVEMPWLARTYARYRPQGLNILGVNMDDGDAPGVQRFVHEMGVTYPIARNNDAIVSAYGGVRFLPQSLLIGRQGEILRRSLGMPPMGEFEMAIASALSRSR